MAEMLTGVKMGDDTAAPPPTTTNATASVTGQGVPAAPATPTAGQGAPAAPATPTGAMGPPNKVYMTADTPRGATALLGPTDAPNGAVLGSIAPGGVLPEGVAPAGGSPVTLTTASGQKISISFQITIN